MKRILYGLGFCSAITFAYFKGYADGINKKPLVEEIDSEDETVERASNAELDTNEEIEEYECDADDCSDTFETEHGKNVHMGLAHDDE